MSRDSADLEAVFERAAAPPAPAPLAANEACVFQRLGALTRNLHDALRELGYDRAVEKAVASLPDARDRLAYIANLTGQAAERTLAATERGRRHQEALAAAATALATRWDGAFAAATPAADSLALAIETRDFLQGVPGAVGRTNDELTEIMLAQDFHDLTGQVIQRIVHIARSVEEQLVKLLIEVTPPEKRATEESAWLNGPVIDPAGRDDVVTSQAQVDDLLESLGF